MFLCGGPYRKHLSLWYPGPSLLSELKGSVWEILPSTPFAFPLIIEGYFFKLTLSRLIFKHLLKLIQSAFKEGPSKSRWQGKDCGGGGWAGSVLLATQSHPHKTNGPRFSVSQTKVFLNSVMPALGKEQSMRNLKPETMLGSTLRHSRAAPTAALAGKSIEFQALKETLHLLEQVFSLLKHSEGAWSNNHTVTVTIWTEYNCSHSLTQPQPKTHSQWELN